MPRLTASRARSLALQWLSGRPLSSGASQAMATIPQVCSALKVAGAPLRGASPSRSMTAAVGTASQRDRCRLTPLRHTPSACAVSATPAPPAAMTIIRARKAVCCGVDPARMFKRRALFRGQSDRGSTARHRKSPKVRITSQNHSSFQTASPFVKQESPLPPRCTRSQRENVR